METEEEILVRHRNEKRNLQNQITGMKKQATKSKRKQVNARCLELEQELSERQKNEITEWNIQNGLLEPEAEELEVTPEQLLEQLALDTAAKSEKTVSASQSPPPTSQEPKKRRNRQKERLAKREQEIARLKEEAAKEAAVQPNFKKIEQEALDQLCAIAHLKQVDIQPDGNCLFASVLDQLQLRHNSGLPIDFPPSYTGTKDHNALDVSALRSLCACYIRDHRNDFIPYLFDENTCCVKDIDEYTKTIEETAEWGGEVEILALAKIFKCCISVMMSGRATYKMNEEASENPELKLVYYKHSYALGEHYNSLHDN